MRDVFNIRDFGKKERRVTLLSFSTFFCLMCAYFILRPVRDEMGVQAGVESIQWLFTGTFLGTLALVPILGWLFKTFPKRRLLPAIYFFCGLNILCFFYLIQSGIEVWMTYVFFIWLSVFNLFAISLFWSLNADLFKTTQARRVFGPIAAGGSLGAIAGPLVTSVSVHEIGISGLLLVSTFLLLLTAFLILKLIREVKGEENTFVLSSRKMWVALQRMLLSPVMREVGTFLLLYTCISTTLYYLQVQVFSESIDSSLDRTAYFSIRDLCVNTITLVIQLFFTSGILGKLGTAKSLMIVPVIAAIGMMVLGVSQSVYLLLIIQIVYRSLNFSIQRPVRETVFTLTSPEDRYQTKNFIDTTIYRGGDATSGWMISGLLTVLPWKVISLLAVPVSLVWALIGKRIGGQIDNIKNAKDEKFYFEKKSA